MIDHKKKSGFEKIIKTQKLSEIERLTSNLRAKNRKIAIKENREFIDLQTIELAKKL